MRERERERVGEREREREGERESDNILLGFFKYIDSKPYSEDVATNTPDMGGEKWGSPCGRIIIFKYWLHAVIHC